MSQLLDYFMQKVEQGKGWGAWWYKGGEKTTEKLEGE